MITVTINNNINDNIDNFILKIIYYSPSIIFRYGDAEARRINTQFELDQTRLEINRLGRELDEVRRLKDLTNVSLRDTFLIKRDPMGQREKWKLAMW